MLANENIDVVVNNFVSIVKNVTKNNKLKRRVSQQMWGNEEKWTRLLKGQDSRKIWKAIDWGGNIENEREDIPSDVQFKYHW